MVHGRTFVLQTYHCLLLSIYGSKNVIPNHSANRLQRWGTILLVYDFEIKYIPSKELGHVDGLSRLIPKFNEPFDDTVIGSLRSENEIKNVLFNTVSELPVTFDEIRTEAKKTILLVKIKNQITSAGFKHKKVPQKIILFLE